MKRLAPLALASFFAIGCAKEVGLSVQLSVAGCADDISPMSPSVLTGVNVFRFVVTANGTAKAPVDVSESDLGTSLPQLPLDQPLRVDIYGLSSSQATSALAFGSSGNFFIASATAPSSVNLNIVMRPVNSFGGTPVLTSENAVPSCSTMTRSRAYHAQTLLSDGRVLIYGGLQFPSGVDWSLVFGLPAAEVPQTTYLSDSEIFDPTTGQFTAAGSFVSSTRDTATRAFGLLAPSMVFDGGAALVGGETPSGAALVGPANGGLFAPGLSDAGWLNFQASSHGHGCIAFDIDGHALVAGGLDGTGAAASEADFFDMTTWLPNVAMTAAATGVNEARVNHGCSGLQGILGAAFEGIIAEAGGFTTDSNGQNVQVLSDVYLFNRPSSDFAYVAGSDQPLLTGPRTRTKAASMSVQDSSGSPTDAVLLTGGLTCDVTDGGSTCTPTFAAASDGGTAGQLGNVIASYLPQAMAATELLAFPITMNGGQESAVPTLFAGPQLPTPRVNHCEVSLADGRILILGGLGPLADGGFGTLSDAMTTAAGAEPNHAGQVAIPILTHVANPLRQARAGMACTLLKDGSVLVTGGYETTGTLLPDGVTQPVRMLNTVEVYQPAPATVP